MLLSPVCASMNRGGRESGATAARTMSYHSTATGAGGDGEVASGARRVDLHRLHVGHVGFCQLWLLGGGQRGEWQDCLGRI